MSDHLSIAAVTKAFCDVLGDALMGELPTEQVKVTAARPGNGTKGEAAVFVFLYRVSPNAARRNEDLPARSSSGELNQRPRLALDLHYLVSFQGDEQSFTPERMLGVVAGHLHAQPVLTPDAIERSLAQAKPPLNACNLAQEAQRIRFTPSELPLDDLTKLWSTLTPASQLLSLAYRASVIHVDAPLTPRAPAPEVREVRIGATPRKATS
jgi:hypothetical protein